MNSKNNIHNNEKMLETIFNNTHFLVAYMDKDFNFIKVNKAYAKKHDKEPDFFVGKNHFELYPNGNESIFRNVIKTGNPYFAYSKPLEHPTLGVTYWDWAIHPIKNQNNGIDSVILTLTDVTEYKRFEDEIQKNQQKFINKLVEKRAADVLKEKEKSEKNMENELIELKEKIDELKNTNKVLKKELKSHETDIDDEFQIEEFDKQIKMLKKANVDFKKIITASNPDIEELKIQIKELKKELEISEDAFSSKLSEINDLNERITELENESSKNEELISKRELEIEKLNQEIIELEKEDSIDSKLIKNKDSDMEMINKSMDALKESLDNYKEDISKKELEIEKLKHELLELKTIKEDSKQIVSAQMLKIQELTENFNKEKQLVIELTKRNKKIKEELENNLNDEELLKQLDELVKANEELDKFAETAANELQEPLRAVKSFVNILSKRYRGKLDNETDEFIDYALEAIERLNKKIIGLLEYSRVESKGKELKPTETHEILDYAISHLNTSWDGYKAEITYDNLPKIMADSGQILKLFQNLLENAVKFKNPEKNSKVHVSAVLDEENDKYIFSVQDNGIGIEEKDFDKIFDIFKKLNLENEHQGVGIGLSISKKIIERHGGQIWVESEPEIGSTFFFALPYK
jgi:PAS domain S-box-containing protein